MDNIQNCDSYINIPSSQTYRSYKNKIFSELCTLIGVVMNSSIFLDITQYRNLQVYRRFRVICHLKLGFK
jgi:hypothetical protein